MTTVAADPTQGSPVPWDDMRLLDVLSERDSIRLYGLGTHLRHPDEESVVCREGAPCAGLYVVLSGRVRLSRSKNGRLQILRYVGPGSTFNLVPVFDGGRNTATATTVEPTELLLIPADGLVQVVADSPQAALIVIQMLAWRMRHVVGLVDDLSFHHVTGRVARILLQSVAPHPGAGAGLVAIPSISQSELAAIAGTSREVVSRLLPALEAQGAIVRERGKIRLADVAQLTALAEGC